MFLRSFHVDSHCLIIRLDEAIKVEGIMRKTKKYLLCRSKAATCCIGCNPSSARHQLLLNVQDSGLKYVNQVEAPLQCIRVKFASFQLCCPVHFQRDREGEKMQLHLGLVRGHWQLHATHWVGCNTSFNDSASTTRCGCPAWSNSCPPPPQDAFIFQNFPLRSQLFPPQQMQPSRCTHL